MLQSLLDLYETTADTELELRFRLDNITKYKKFIGDLKGSRSIEQSINFITPGDGSNRICSVAFVNGEKRDRSYIEKKQLRKTNVFSEDVPYKIAVSTEIKIPEFSVNFSKLARIKLRLSVRPPELDNWVFDFTLVKTVYNIKNDIKNEKKKMLFPIKIKSFLNDAPWEFADSMEFEVEHLPSTDRKVTASEIEKVVNYVMNNITPGHKNKNLFYKKVHYVAKHIVAKNRLKHFKRSSTRALYNKVWELNRESYYKVVFSNIQNYYISAKADGVRTFCIIEDKSLYMVNNELKEIKLKKDNEKPTIFDAEFVEGKLFVFDVILFKGVSVVKEDTSKRIGYISKVVALSEGNCHPKEFVRLTAKYPSEIKKFLDKKRPYKTDGKALIFTPSDSSYTTMKPWKYKPVDHMSIDLLVKKPSSNILGISPYERKEGHTLLFLFCSIGKRMFDNLRLTPVPGYFKIFPKQKLFNTFPIQFSPADDPFAYVYYHPNNSEIKMSDILGSVCEFKRDKKNTSWEMMRVRTDRQIDVDSGSWYGNSFYVAEYTWLNYQNPLTLSDITMSQSDYIDKGYFKNSKSVIYAGSVGLNSYIKNKLIMERKDSKWLVDLAGGRGVDMLKVSRANIKNALYIDNDSKALSELISRKHKFQTGIKKLNTRVFTKVADLNNPHEGIIASIKKMGIPVGLIDVVMCNFALHYIMRTPRQLRNVILMVKELLKSNGIFMLTAPDGKKIFELLKDKKEWSVRTGEVLKYHIKKKYKSDTLEKHGQMIDILLPFSGGKPYEEQLVNFSYVLSEFKKAGFTVVKHNNFSSLIPEFKRNAPKVFGKMDEDDKIFSSLYSYAVLKKKGISPREENKKIDKKFDS